MKMLADRFRSALIEDFSKYSPKRGISFNIGEKCVVGIIVDYYAEDVECDGLRFEDVDFLQVWRIQPTEENLDGLNTLDVTDAIIDVPVFLAENIETWDI